MNRVNWSAVARRWIRTHLDTGVPVFETANRVVQVRMRGDSGRPLLCRTPALEEELARITDTVLSRHMRDVEGMLYCLFTRTRKHAQPLYIGIAKATNRAGELSSVYTRSRKKPHFTDYDGSLLYDLSTQVLFGYSRRKEYMKEWAIRLFDDTPSRQPMLRTSLYFRGIIWHKNTCSGVSPLGHTPLDLEKPLLVHAFNLAFPGTLLNP